MSKFHPNSHSARGFSRDADIDYIRRLVAQGGPREEDDDEFNAWMARAHAFAVAGQLQEQDKLELLNAFGAAMSPLTMQGFAVNKPHGYAGDFEIIDRIYQHHISTDPALANWDHFFHRQAAPKAVRNRKTYFHRLLDHHDSASSRVLKIGVGPGRSMFEWLSANPSSKTVFDCVEIDPNAVRYATELNRPFLDRIKFFRKNCLKFQPSQQYELIWAAGIFDYFDDATFLQMVPRLLAAVAHGGELVVGNFASTNPCRPYMEFGDAWFLHHRSAHQLVALAMQCGVERERIAIGCEELGVNLFLHIMAPFHKS